MPKKDGSIDFPPNTWKLQQIVETAHAKNIRVLISVGGWGLDQEFEAFAASPELRAKFISSLMQYVDAHNLDGVDMDWEYPTGGASSENFLALMQELRAELDARKKLLTAAVAAYGDNADGIPDATFALVDFLNLMAYADSGAHDNADGIPDATFALVDFLNLMAYADSGAHHSSYVAQQTLDYWHARGLPQSKMVLGVPFYASPGDVSFAKLVKSDPRAAQTDFFNYHGVIAAYNGLPTMRAKTQLALERAGGIMFWTLNQDAPGENSLLNAIVETAQGKKSTLPPLPFGAGFRFSTYGPPYDPGATYWADFAKNMSERFDGAPPQIIWIVGNVSGTGTQLTFFGKSANPQIHFSMRDRNDEALTLFDALGAQVWLQVEPGNAPVEELIELVLKKYAHHHARLWRDTARKFNPTYRLFLKHWAVEKMPPTERAGIVFVDDSQGVASRDALVSEFETWGKTFAPAQVGFQFGYPADKKWWGALQACIGWIFPRSIFFRQTNNRFRSDAAPTRASDSFGAIALD
ncbi:MAG: hypothetical protein DCC52_19385 [Chloroflexi bacterium]|nr:MAG: hypothetical protein DCC52_19385 [Chloroflexota bacterium]